MSKRLWLAFFSVVLAAVPAFATVWYVDINSPGPQTGASWTEAFHAIQPAIEAASNAVGANNREVWIAKGLYSEERSDPSGAILMKPGVHLYGGFAGGETTRDQRDWNSNVVVVNGAMARGGSAAYHVFISAQNTTLDGFIIVGGDASGVAAIDQNGGGIYIDAGTPAIRNCTFGNNTAGWGGGIAFVEDSSPIIEKCTFSGNVATVNGGGIHGWGSGSATIQQCWFISNQADRMGGAFMEGVTCHSLVKNCLFFTNVAGNMGGAVANYNGGQSRFVNCSFYQNSTENLGFGGGALGSWASNPEIMNCSFYNNQSANGGAAYNNSSSAAIPIANSILWGNTDNEVSGAFDISYSDVQGGYDGNGNINAYPEFLVPQTGMLYLTFESPCIDVGTASNAPQDDLLGNPRPVDIPGVGGDGGEMGFDMGAYEFQTGINEGEGSPDGEGAPDGEGSPEGEGEGNAACEEQCPNPPNSADQDHDGLTDCIEDCLGTNPAKLDSDNDGMPDNFEVTYGLDPLHDDAAGDPDEDALNNLEEFLQHADPKNPNSPSPVYYVSLAGNDFTGVGSKDQPWASLSHALSQVFGAAGASKRIIVLSGEYVEFITLNPWVTIAGATGHTVVIRGSVVGADHSGLENLTIAGDSAEIPLLTMNDVVMNLLGVSLVGALDRSAVGIQVSGAVVAGALIEGCVFNSLRIGIDIQNAIPIIRRSIFQNIAQAGIVIQNNIPTKTWTKSLGDQTDPASGWNTFNITPDTGAKAVINERDEPISMENNDWGSNDPETIASLIDGPADFEPFLAAGSAILAASLFCTVWDDKNNAPILTASVSITPSAFAPVSENKNGVYAFPAIGEGTYSVNTSAPGYLNDNRVVNLGSGAVVSLAIPMASPTEEGEGFVDGEEEGNEEGEGEPEPEPSCFCNKSAPALPQPDQIVLAGLSVFVLYAFQAVRRR